MTTEQTPSIPPNTWRDLAYELIANDRARTHSILGLIALVAVPALLIVNTAALYGWAPAICAAIGGAMLCIVPTLPAIYQQVEERRVEWSIASFAAQNLPLNISTQRLEAIKRRRPYWSGRIGALAVLAALLNLGTIVAAYKNIPTITLVPLALLGVMATIAYGYIFHIFERDMVCSHALIEHISILSTPTT